MPTNSEGRDWKNELKKFQERLEVLENSQDAEEKRNQLYCDLELTRMDFCEQESVASFLYKYDHLKGKENSDAKAKLAQTEQGTEVLGILETFDKIRYGLRISSDLKFNPISAGIRLVCALSFILACMPLLFLTVPLRWIHPFLRTMGVNNNYLPIDMITKWVARGFLSCAGVTLQVEGPTPDIDRNYILMFQHVSNLDPFISNAGQLSFKFIGKKAISRIPLLGWLIYLHGHIFIDRSNQQRAIESLNKASAHIRKYKRSIAISPEGTRSKTGRLADFKKGAFHTAKDVEVDILPMVLQGAFELWPPQHFFAVPGTVRVRYLEPIPVTESDDYLSLRSKTRRAMLKGGVKPIKSGQTQNGVMDILRVPIAYALLYAAYTFFCG